MNKPAPRRILGTLTASSAVLFTFAWIIAPAAEPGYRPLRDDLSALETLTATHPWIMIGGSRRDRRPSTRPRRL